MYLCSFTGSGILPSHPVLYSVYYNSAQKERQIDGRNHFFEEWSPQGASIGRLVRFPQTVPEKTASRFNIRNAPFHQGANGFPYLLLLADKKGTSFRTFLFTYGFVLCA